jgi:hypothetical protein
MSDRPYFCNVCQLPASACQCSEFARLRSEVQELTRLFCQEANGRDQAERRVSVLMGRLAWALEELDAEKEAAAKLVGLGHRPRGRVWSRRRGSDREAK